MNNVFNVTEETYRSYNAATAAFVENSSPDLVIGVDDVDGVMIFSCVSRWDKADEVLVWDWDLMPYEVGAGSFESALKAVWAMLREIRTTR